MFKSIGEAQAIAKEKLPKFVYDYYASGAETETTLRDNLKAFGRYRLFPRMMVNVKDVDLSTTLLGRRLAMPVIVAPAAMQRLAHPEGEVAAARAAEALGTSYILSTMATSSIEEVAGCNSFRMFQLYVLRDRAATEGMVRRAESAGYAALVVTVDAPKLGRRNNDEKNQFKLPPGLELKNIAELGRRAADSMSSGAAEGGSGLAKLFADQIDPSLTWECIDWLRSITSMPVLVKGVLRPDDAAKAVSHGAAGVIVSNHGGRQCDFAPAGIDALSAVIEAVGGRVPVLVDGGVRRGTDVVKCLALGASAVLVARPVLWGLAAGGQGGVEAVLRLLRDELELAMQLVGCPDVASVDRSVVIAPGEEVGLMAGGRIGGVGWSLRARL